MRVNISLDSLNNERYREITRGGNLLDVLRGIDAAKNAGLLPVKINCVIRNSSSEEDAISVSEFCKQNGLELRFIKLMNLREGIFSIVEHGDGGNCEQCNRLRLTANGKLKPCLFSDVEYDIRNLGYEQSLQMALQNKPQCGSTNKTNMFSNIGG